MNSKLSTFFTKTLFLVLLFLCTCSKSSDALKTSTNSPEPEFISVTTELATSEELSDQETEEMRCPECIIQREILDKLPPTIYPPRNTQGGPMTLLTKIVVKELMDMSVKTETLTVMAWIRMYWFNYDVNWNISRLNIREIRVKPSQVWVPDMVISNSLSSFEIMGASNLPLIVGHTGFTYYSVPVIIKTRCKATVTYFPFDEQACEILFLSWTYHSRMVNLKLSSYTTGLEDHIGNIEWKITNITSSIVNEHDVSNHPLYVGETIRYPYIRYEIRLSRKPDFYVNSLITPSLLLSWLGSIIFLLPSDCGEKLGFSVTLFLALYVNQVVVSDFLPPSADSFPLLARFYTSITLIMGLSIIMTVLSLTVHFRVEPKLMPRKGSLLYSILCQLEKLGSCSLLTIINCILGIFHTKEQEQATYFETYSSAKFGRYHENNLLRNSSRISSTKNGFYNNKPVEFAYNSACARPIPNSTGQSTRLEDTVDKPETKPDWLAETWSFSQGNSLSPVDEIQTELPKELCDSLAQIKSQLDTISKTPRDEKRDGNKRKWVLIAAGMDTLFFFTYILILIAVTLFFGYKSIF